MTEKEELSEIGDVRELSVLMDEARNRGAERVKKLLENLSQRYREGVKNLDERIRVSPQDQKTLLLSRQKELRDRILSENLETRKSIIMLDNKIQRLAEIMKHVKVALHLEQDPFQQIALRGRIDLLNERIQKMQIKRSNLEGILSELNKAAIKTADNVFLERVTPIDSDLDDLFAEIDRAQTISNGLTGISSEELGTLEG